MNIHKATKRYESWMRSCTAVIEGLEEVQELTTKNRPDLLGLV
jgi:hypothetical protein